MHSILNLMQTRELGINGRYLFGVMYMIEGDIIWFL